MLERQTSQSSAKITRKDVGQTCPTSEESHAILGEETKVPNIVITKRKLSIGILNIGNHSQSFGLVDFLVHEKIVVDDEQSKREQ